jgi:phenylacetic acid degradation protein
MPKVYSIDGIGPVVHSSAFVHPSAILIGDVIVGARAVPARPVHAAFLAALSGFYAKVVRADEL